jgi:hypothetical protein
VWVRAVLKLLVLAPCLTVLACDDSLVACPAVALAGLDVNVTSTSSSQPICDATVTAVEGSHSERLAPVGCRYQGAYERPGTYTIRAERPGFAPLELSGVRVVMGTGPCPHVQTVTVALPLKPLP